VIAAPPPGLDVLGFRDPWVWREADGWYAIVGSGIRDLGGTAFLYRSPDLIAWTYLKPLCVGDPRETGTMWECPSLFALGGKHVLVISPIPLRKALYLVGTYRDHTFNPEAQAGLDEGGCFYAPQTLLDAKGRRLMWGWLQEDRSAEACRAAGWAGVMSLPRVLDLGADRLLRVTPPDELRLLRGRHVGLRDVALDADVARPLEVRGDCLELVLEIEPADASAVELAVRRAPHGEEQTRIVYDAAARLLVVDRRQASRDPLTVRDVRATTLALAAGETLRLRVFLDRSVVETFANDRACLASRIYPTRADSLGLALTAVGGQAHLRSLDAWEMLDPGEQQ
jgi:beta-fructofuranosidase